MTDHKNAETCVGYVIDIACLRKAPNDEVLDRAVGHTTDCGLMGHCVESGFALVDDDGRIQHLDPAATTLVVRELLATDVEEGFRVRVRRERHGEKMRTVDIQPVESVAASPQAQP